MAETSNRDDDAPDDEIPFREWWAEFLADWHRRYPHAAPPSEASARVAFAESQAARARHRQDRPQHLPPPAGGRRRLA